MKYSKVKVSDDREWVFAKYFDQVIKLYFL